MPYQGISKTLSIKDALEQKEYNKFMLKLHMTPYYQTPTGINLDMELVKTIRFVQREVYSDLFEMCGYGLGNHLVDNIAVVGKPSKTLPELELKTILRRSMFGCHFGDFNASYRVIEYIKKWRATNLLKHWDIGTLQKGKTFLETLMRVVPELPPYSAICIAGGIFVETGFDWHDVNTFEESGKSLSKGVSGASGSGECFFLITHWESKLKVIKALNLQQYGVSADPSTYGKNGSPRIADLSEEILGRVFHLFVNHGLFGKYIFNDITDHDRTLGACWLYKSGVHVKLNWDDLLGTAMEEADWKLGWYARTPGYSADHTNGFASCCAMCIVLSLYVKDGKTTELPF